MGDGNEGRAQRAAHVERAVLLPDIRRAGGCRCVVVGASAAGGTAVAAAVVAAAAAAWSGPCVLAGDDPVCPFPAGQAQRRAAGRRRVGLPAGGSARRGQVARWLWPWLALAAACAVWTKLVQPAAAAGTVAPWLRPLIAADALAFYLYKILWPTRLGLDYGRRPSVALAEGWAYVTWVVPAVVGLLLWSCRRRAPALLAAGVAFVAALTPVLGLIRFDFQTYSTVSDHYLYVPMFAVAFAVAWALSRVPPRAQGLKSLSCLSCLRSWAARSRLQASYWEDSVSLFEHAREVNPRSAPAYNSLAAHFVAQHKTEAAIEYARESVHLRPDQIIGFVTLAKALIQAGRQEEAIQSVREGCIENPDSAVFVSTLAGILAQSGRLDEALPLARRAVAMQPDLADARVAVGSILAARGERSEALAELQKAVELQPTLLAAQLNLAHTLEAAGRPF